MCNSMLYNVMEMTVGFHFSVAEDSGYPQFPEVGLPRAGSVLYWSEWPQYGQRGKSTRRTRW